MAWWNDETPQTITGSRNTLQYYAKAGKLSVAKPMWEDRNGKMCQGKTVAFDLIAMVEDGPESAHDLYELLGEMQDLVASLMQ